MPANAGLYLPIEGVDLADVFPNATSAGSFSDRKSAFRVPFKDTSVKFNVMPRAAVAEHLEQFVAYIESLQDSLAAKEAAKAALRNARTVLGLQTELEFEEDEDLMDLLDRILNHYKGCMFIFDSVVLHDGTVLVGPLKDNPIRAARVDEAGLLSDLALRSKAHWGYSPEFIERCREELTYDEEQLRCEDMRFFVVENDQRIVGFYALKLLGANEIELEAMFVEPSLIGQGFGRLLMEHAKLVGVELGAKQLIVQSDPYAERFYKAAGGVVTGTRESASIPGRYLPTLAIDLTADV
jgi:GNAT superfamily N-acetyltransferase